jgi:hypothetical protein
MKNSWFFGDSFTYGFGCLPTYEFYEKYPLERDKIWTTMVSEHLNTKEKNFGIGGNSNPYIIKQILENLPKFKKGDYVFIGSTFPYRIVYPDRNNDKINTLIFDMVLFDKPDSDSEKNYLDKFIPDLDERKIILDFISSSVFNDEKTWDSYYKVQYNGIVSLLNKIGINAYLWNRHHMSKHESITSFTNSHIIDNHWSWNGHKTFFNYIIDKVENKLI